MGGPNSWSLTWDPGLLGPKKEGTEGLDPWAYESGAGEGLELNTLKGLEFNILNQEGRRV